MRNSSYRVFSAVLFCLIPAATFATDAVTRPMMRPISSEMVNVIEPLSRAPEESLRPNRRDGDVVPRARWDHRPAGRIWTRSAISALKSHGKPILQTVPRDIVEWCPAYPDASEDQRAAFWAGFMSALAKHESTYQISARRFGRDLCPRLPNTKAHIAKMRSAGMAVGTVFCRFYLRQRGGINAWHRTERASSMDPQI